MEDRRMFSRFARAISVALLLMLVTFSGIFSNAQSRKRIAILGFDDRSVQTQSMGIGQRVTDELISALAETGSFEVIDREYLRKILAEQTQGYGDRFSADGAAKLGKLANADILILGQIDAFSANVTTENQTSILGSKVCKWGSFTTWHC